MNITTIELQKLTADDGMVLTNGDTFGKEIYLGKTDHPDNWQEITDEEAKRRQSEEILNESGGDAV